MSDSSEAYLGRVWSVLRSRILTLRCFSIPCLVWLCIRGLCMARTRGINMWREDLTDLSLVRSEVTTSSFQHRHNCPVSPKQGGYFSDQESSGSRSPIIDVTLSLWHFRMSRFEHSFRRRRHLSETLLKAPARHKGGVRFSAKGTQNWREWH